MRRAYRAFSFCAFSALVSLALAASAQEDEDDDRIEPLPAGEPAPEVPSPTKIEPASGEEEAPADPAPVMDLAQLTRAAERSYPGVAAASMRIRAAQAQLDEAWVSPFFQSTITAGIS